MNNSTLADVLLEMAHALEFLDDNPYRAKAYERAARSVLELAVPVEELLDSGGICNVKGVGESIAATIKVLVKDRDFSALNDLKDRLPSGYDELVKVQGLGLKRLKILWKELNISTIDELLEAIDAGRLSSVKGFSEKSIARLKGSANAILDYRGWFLIDAAYAWADAVTGLLAGCGIEACISGVARRAMEVVSTIDLLVEERPGLQKSIEQCIASVAEMRLVHDGDTLAVCCPGKPPVKIHCAPHGLFVPAMFITTGSSGHVDRVNSHGLPGSTRVSGEGVFSGAQRVSVRSEEEIYELFGLPFLPPEVREGRTEEIDLALSGKIRELVTREDLKGLLHVHTTYSDGRTTLADMVHRAKDRGYSWIGIADHSRSAYYAGGLSPKDLKQQFEEIDELNNSVHGITIFKGIESDILPDGSLDYPPTLLRQFDFVIASIHSHMDMDRQSMTKRIVTAFKNPFTTILGHPTGRLLLARRAYEVDMDAVLAEAAAQGVFVELNANPLRLDLDWRLVHGFAEQGGRVVIAPDAHSIEGLDDMRYGLALARKGLLLKDSCINAFSAQQASEAFRSRWS